MVNAVDGLGGGLEEARALGPVRLVLRHLPQLPTTREGTIDYASADPILLRHLAEAAETIARSLHLGTGAIGQLMAYSAPELEDSTISSDSVEALGWLLSTLGELGAQMAMLAVHCGQAAGRADSTP